MTNNIDENGTRERTSQRRLLTDQGRRGLLSSSVSLLCGVHRGGGTFDTPECPLPLISSCLRFLLRLGQGLLLQLTRLELVFITLLTANERDSQPRHCVSRPFSRLLAINGSSKSRPFPSRVRNLLRRCWGSSTSLGIGDRGSRLR
ncbi:hypothetical protein Taro_046617 [Colocasia esculenta]|uniref:Uncharacterized protein n=1 Tax=Colocasia esculenta TaxID=4460 RepID=A0A843WZI1_COLES|nr:hypothetical protein [Colocasia esculenta]